MLQTLITETYGGKIDSASDMSILQSLVTKFLTPLAFEDSYVLAEPEDERGTPLLVPEGTEMTQFVKWVNQLPEREPPTYLGLPGNAEKLLLVGHGREMIEKLGVVVGALEEGEVEEGDV